MAPALREPAEFRIFGWTWHHKSCLRDLRLVRDALNGGRICAPGAAGERRRRDVARAYSHVLDDNFEIHDMVESKLLFPLLHARAGTARRLAIDLLSSRRRALASRRERLRDDIARLNAHCCDVRAARAAADVELVRRAAAGYFDVAERVVVPAVRAHYSVVEQEAFNRRVLRMLSPLQAQIALVIFRDTLYDRGSGASDQDRANFESQVPRAIRALVPVWRTSLLAWRSAILTPTAADDEAPAR